MAEQDNTNLEQEPLPLAQWEVQAETPSALPLLQGLLAGDWQATGRPSTAGKRAAAAAWGLLLALVHLVTYHLLPSDGNYAPLLDGTRAGWALALLVAAIGYGVGSAALEARERRGLGLGASVAMLGGMVAGLLLAAVTWQPGPAWAGALVLLPILGAAAAFLAADLHQQGYQPALVALGPIGMILIPAVLVYLLSPPLAVVEMVATARQHGPLMAFVRAGSDPATSTDLGLLGGLALGSDEQTAALAVKRLGDLKVTDAVPLLQRVAMLPDRDLSTAAVQALAQDGSPEALKVLEELPGRDAFRGYVDSEQARRERAPQNLARSIADLSSTNLEARRAAVKALEVAGGPEHVSALIVALRDEDEEVRCAAARGLDRLKAREALEPLMQAAVKDPSRSVRNCATFALMDLEDPRAIPVLVEASRNKQEDSRQWAAYRGLARLPDPRSARAMIAWMVELENQRPNNGREALIEMKAQAEQPLIKAATSPDYHVRRNVVPLLRELYPTDATAMAAAKRGEAMYDAERLKVEVQERRGKRVPAADLVLRGARTDNVALRTTAEESVDELFLDGDFDILAKGIKDPDPRVRAMAALALGSNLLQRKGEQLLRQAMKDKSPLVRRAAVLHVEKDVGPHGPAPGPAPVVYALRHDPDLQVRLLAAKRLADTHVDTDDRVEIYRVLLNDKQAAVRAAAVDIVEGRCGRDEAAAAALHQALKDTNPVVRQKAEKALRNFPKSP